MTDGVYDDQGGRRRVPQNYQPQNRKEPVHAPTYQMSRWIPYIKDLMEVLHCSSGNCRLSPVLNTQFSFS